ncbi:MAG TPA: DUF5914 domain-containing protein [Pseudonocardiaceae bacterium]|nr:DUF5914 domain-containing protein [Pseudonocardiaceae bacterium]
MKTCNEVMRPAMRWAAARLWRDALAYAQCRYDRSETPAMAVA